MFPVLRQKIWAMVEAYYADPCLKDEVYSDSTEWMTKFTKYLDDDGIPDEKIADAVYEYAMTEVEDCSKAHESLTEKASDLMKLIMTIVGAFLALWRYAVAADKSVNISLVASNTIAAIAIGMFVFAVIILARALRGQQYIGNPTIKNVLDWYTDKASASYIKLRLSARIYRNLNANRKANDRLHARIDRAWEWTIRAIGVLALSIVARLFA